MTDRAEDRQAVGRCGPQPNPMFGNFPIAQCRHQSGRLAAQPVMGLLRLGGVEADLLRRSARPTANRPAGPHKSHCPTLCVHGKSGRLWRGQNQNLAFDGHHRRHRFTRQPFYPRRPSSGSENVGVSLIEMERRADAGNISAMSFDPYGGFVELQCASRLSESRSKTPRQSMGINYGFIWRPQRARNAMPRSTVP